MSVQRTVMSRYTQLQMASGPGIYDNYKLQVNSYGETSVFNRDCGQLVGIRRDTSLVTLLKNRETLRNTRYSVNQSQKTVLTEDYLDSYTDIN